jgi:hypothetical protein
VKKEGNFHRFLYSFTSGCTGVTFSNFDLDTQTPTPQPIGLTFQMTVPASTASGSCTLRVVLHHYNTAKGDGTGGTFDTDLDIDFPVTIS